MNDKKQNKTKKNKITKKQKLNRLYDCKDCLTDPFSLEDILGKHPVKINFEGFIFATQRYKNSFCSLFI